MQYSPQSGLFGTFSYCFFLSGDVMYQHSNALPNAKRFALATGQVACIRAWPTVPRSQTAGLWYWGSATRVACIKTEKARRGVRFSKLALLAKKT